MNIKEIREEMKKYKLAMMSEKTGINYDTIRNIAIGRTENPSFEKTQKICEYMRIKL